MRKMRQRGFTLIELLVSLAIGSLVMSGATLTIYQVLTNTARNDNQIIVYDEVNRAALRLKKDLQSRDSANISADSASISLQWIDQTFFEGGTPQEHEVSYSLLDTNLMRTSGNITGIVARHIEQIIFSGNDEYIDVVITARSPHYPYRDKTLGFRVYKRMAEIE